MFEKVHIQDMLTHHDLLLELEPVTFITGPNRIGKSSIRDMIEFVLRGNARDLQYKKNVGELRREGTKIGRAHV